MDWWVQPAESVASLMASAHIMEPICLAGCLILMSLCMLVYLTRTCKPEDEEMEGDGVGDEGEGLGAGDGESEGEETDFGVEDGQLSLPLMRRHPSSLPQEGEIAEDAEPGTRRPSVPRTEARAPASGPPLPYLDRVRIAKDVLPGFGIVLAILFLLLLFVVITTLHRAEGLPLVRPSCMCLDDLPAPAPDHEAEEAAGELRRSDFCKCFCKLQALDGFEKFSLNDIRYLCKGTLPTTLPQESSAKMYSGDQYPEARQSLRVAASDLLRAYEYRSDERKEGPIDIRANNAANSGVGILSLPMQPGLVRKKRQDIPDKLGDDKWDFFTPKNTNVVIVVALLAAIVALGICQIIVRLRKLMKKISTQMRCEEAVVVYHDTPQPISGIR